MNPTQLIEHLKDEIIQAGNMLWEKDLASGLNGNISARAGSEGILITATKTCLGLLGPDDILLMSPEGRVLGQGEVSTEKLLHTEIYRNLPAVKAVVHTHTTYTNAYFLEQNVLTPRIFETKVYLGEIQAVPQSTPAVTDTKPVIEALKRNNIAVLKNHGIVAVGSNLMDCFLLIQYLEEAVKMEAISRLFKSSPAPKAETQNLQSPQQAAPQVTEQQKKYKLFSQEQISEIVKLVNEDLPLKEMGEKTQMTMDLAVQLNETGQAYKFQFDNGRIKDVTQDNSAEFVISAPESVWRSVFNREIDPFVATTQKKMDLKGDFAKISKWYAPCSRIFELWQRVPVE